MYYSTPSLDDRILTPKTSQKQALEELQNGDLVLLSGGSHGEALCKWFCGSPFSHVGLVFRDTSTNDTLYLIEADLGQGKKSGIRAIPLREKLARYRGNRVAGYKKLVILSGEKRPSTSRASELVHQNLHVKQDNLMVSWLFSESKIGAITKRNSHMFCSEFIAHMLIELGILNNDRPAYSYSPGDFDTGRLSLNRGFFYSKTKYFERDS